MVVLNKIYTKTGDSGETSLGDGTRVAKHALRVHVYGSVDELNSFLGLARTEADKNLDKSIGLIQNDLFDLGGDLCFPVEEGEKEKKYPPLRMTDTQVLRLEKEIDEMNSHLEPLKSFILPGGNELSGWLHLARTINRRCEISIVKLSEKIIYLFDNPNIRKRMGEEGYRIVTQEFSIDKCIENGGHWQ